MIQGYFDLPRPVYVLCVGQFVNRAGTFVLPFLAMYLQRELDMGDAFATQVMGVYGAGALVASVVGGHLADSIGRKAVMLVSLFGAAGMLAVFPTLGDAASIMVAAFVLALLGEMYRPAASAMIADLVPSAQRGHAFGLMYFSINLGFAFAPFIGGELATHSFDWLFWGDGATCGAYGLIIALAIRETLPARIRRSVHSDGDGADAASGIAAIPPSDPPAKYAMRRILRDGPFLVFCLATLITASVYMQAMTTLPLFLKGFDEISVATYGRLIAINGIMIVIFQLPTTALISRLPRGAVIAAGTLVTGVGFALHGLAGGAFGFAVAIMVWTAGELMQAPIMQAVVSDMAPVELRGRYMGVFSMTFSAAMMVGVPIGGWVLTRFGGGPLWASCLGASFVATALYLSIYRRMVPRHEESAAAPVG